MRLYMIRSALLILSSESYQIETLIHPQRYISLGGDSEAERGGTPLKKRPKRSGGSGRHLCRHNYNFILLI